MLARDAPHDADCRQIKLIQVESTESGVAGAGVDEKFLLRPFFVGELEKIGTDISNLLCPKEACDLVTHLMEFLRNCVVAEF